MSLRVAVLQNNLLIGDARKNVEIFLAYLEKFSKKADLLVTTELFLCGYPPKDLLLQSSFLDLCKKMIEKIDFFYRDFYRKGIHLPSSLVGAPEAVEENGCKTIYNSAFFFSKKGLQRTIRKSCLPNYDIFDEKRYFVAAKDFDSQHDPIVDIPLLNERKNLPKSLPKNPPKEEEDCSSVKVLVTICEDMWINWIFHQSHEAKKNVWHQKALPHLKNVFNPIAFTFSSVFDKTKSKTKNTSQKDFPPKNLPKLIVNLSASPFSKEKIEQRYDVARYALKYFDDEVMLLCVNQVGANDELIFDGTSFLAKGSKKNFSIVKILNSFVEEIGIFSFSFGKKSQEKSSKEKLSQEKNLKVKKTLLADENNFSKLIFDDYQKVNFSNFPKNGDPFSFAKKEIIKSEKKSKELSLIRGLMLGIADYVKKNNFSSVVVGLSGGIDSAVTATLATLALGSDRVFTISLPSKYSSKHSLDDSFALVKNLGCHHKVFPIENLVKSFDEQWKSVVEKPPVDLVEQNVQARMRGLILMAFANQNGHLLLTTGNKSELSVGYCTLYGDTNGAIGVLGDCFKTEVYALALAINKFFKKQWIPKKIIDKEPSAELSFGQKDSDSLPPYDILDKILELAIVYELSQAEVKKCGFEGKMVEKIYSLIAKSEYKRSQSPPILKISQRALGSGRRIPITKSRLW